MSETIKAMGEIAGKSFLEEKTKHAVNLGTAGTAVAVSSTGMMIGGIIEWLPTVAVFASICVSTILFRKEYLNIKKAKMEIQLLQTEISLKSRRKTDRTTEPLKPGPYVK